MPCPVFLDSFSGLDMTTSSPANTSLMANAIRALAMDAVQQANSGHPGMPMGMAEIGVALWSRHLRHNPTNPHWADRDRFVLSNGHGSMLLYSLLHLSGYALRDRGAERTSASCTPRRRATPNTASRRASRPPPARSARVWPTRSAWRSARRCWRPSSTRPTRRSSTTTPTCSSRDGCLMEGISHEACSLAGTLKLNKLIALYDDNGISIDGDVVNWFHDDTPEALRGLWLERDPGRERP